MVRRLPVINESSDRAPDRTPFGWIALGAGLSLALWAAMSTVLLPLGARAAQAVSGVGPDASVAALAAEVSPGRGALVLLLTAGPVLLGFVGAAAVSAFIVARLGRALPARLGPAIGVSAAAVAWALATVTGTLGPVPVALFALAVLVLFGAAGGWLGGRLGGRSR